MIMKDGTIFCDLCDMEIKINEDVYFYTFTEDGREYEMELCKHCKNVIDDYEVTTGDKDWDEIEIGFFLYKKHCLNCEKDKAGCSKLEVKCELIKEMY